MYIYLYFRRVHRTVECKHKTGTVYVWFLIYVMLENKIKSKDYWYYQHRYDINYDIFFYYIWYNL